MFLSVHNVLAFSSSVASAVLLTRVQLASLNLPEDRRGSFPDRVQYAALAVLTNVLESLDGASKDPYTKKRRLDTVISLPSREWTCHNAKPLQAPSSYSGNTRSNIPVFVKEDETNFGYAGNLNNLTDILARRDITNAYYVRCQDVVPLSPQPTSIISYSSHNQALMRLGGGPSVYIESPENETSPPQEGKQYIRMGDAIITETQNPSDCRSFTAFLEIQKNRSLA
jgi:hypothetical protein